jgi:molecular chaperone DnaK
MLDSAVYQAEKLKSDNADKLTDDDKKALDEAVEDAKKVLADEKADKDALEAGAKALNDKLMPIGAKMYEQTGSGDPTADDSSTEDGASSEDSSKDGPIEGEVVDEDKK